MMNDPRKQVGIVTILVVGAVLCTDASTSGQVTRAVPLKVGRSCETGNKEPFRSFCSIYNTHAPILEKSTDERRVRQAIVVLGSLASLNVNSETTGKGTDGNKFVIPEAAVGLLERAAKGEVACRGDRVQRLAVDTLLGLFDDAIRANKEKSVVLKHAMIVAAVRNVALSQAEATSRLAAVDGLIRHASKITDLSINNDKVRHVLHALNGIARNVNGDGKRRMNREERILFAAATHATSRLVRGKAPIAPPSTSAVADAGGGGAGNGGDAAANGGPALTNQPVAASDVPTASGRLTASGGIGVATTRPFDAARDGYSPKRRFSATTKNPPAAQVGAAGASGAARRSKIAPVPDLPSPKIPPANPP